MQGAGGRGQGAKVERFWVNRYSIKTLTDPMPPALCPLPYTFSHGSNFLNFFFDLGSLFSR